MFAIVKKIFVNLKKSIDKIFANTYNIFMYANKMFANINRKE